MIKSITQGLGIEVIGGGSPYPYVNMSNSSAGMVRYNGNTSNFEVYDGYSWCSVSSISPMISLDKETQSILSWAKKKRDEEISLEERAKTNPALADLISQRNELEEKIKTIDILTR